MARPHFSRSAASPRSGPADVLVVLSAWVMLWVAGLFGDTASMHAPATPIAAAVEAIQSPPECAPDANAPEANAPDGQRVDDWTADGLQADERREDERRKRLDVGDEQMQAAAGEPGSESDPDLDGHFAGAPEALGLLATASTARGVARPRAHDRAAHAATRAPPTTAAPVA